MAQDFPIFTRNQLWAYGLFGLPLALVALPIYVYVPQYYAEHFHLGLAEIGFALLVARFFDAFLDPAMGYWVDHGRGDGGYAKYIVIAAPPLLFGFWGLFHPVAWAADWPLTWFMGTLVLVYAGFSLATISHQSWGAALNQQPRQRTRLVATREACGLMGVILAASIAQMAGVNWLSFALILSFVIAAPILLFCAPRPQLGMKPDSGTKGLLLPFGNRLFLRLFSVFIVNGIASAIPATLFLFFAKDRLHLEAYSGGLLVVYFLAAAASMPFWMYASSKIGEANAWFSAMLLAVTAFMWVFALTAGSLKAFGVICIFSGIALGADLALPSALLAGVIRAGGHSGRCEGAYFGIWNWANKMNLALAAGIALPLLNHLDYVPGNASPDGNQSLAVAYAILPCALKAIAATLLWRSPLVSLR